MASIFDKKASFQLGDVTVTLSVDPTSLGIRPWRYAAVQPWLNEFATVMEKSLRDSGEVYKFKPAKPVKTHADG